MQRQGAKTVVSTIARGRQWLNDVVSVEEHEREGLDPPDIYPHPDDVIIDETTGEVTIDGPTSKDCARKAVRAQAFEEMRRYFEVEAALKKEPKNQVLRREFKELKVYYDFLMRGAERITRHKALRASRRALEKTQPEDDTSDQ